MSNEYTYFIVILTKHHELLDSYVTAVSGMAALERMIDQYDLSGMVLDYKLCKMNLI